MSAELRALDALEIERALIDPLSLRVGHYSPSVTQSMFHARFSIPDQRPYFSLVSGGGRTGKTTACLIDLAWCLRGIHPYMPWRGPFTAIVFCISRQQAAMVSGKKLFESCEFDSEIDRRALATDPRHVPLYPNIASSPLIPEFEIASLDAIRVGFRSIQHVRLHNGCEVFFSWSDVEETWKRIQGPKIGYIYIDENAGNRKLIIEARKRLQDSQHPGSWHGQLVWGGHGTEDNDAFEDMKARALDPGDTDHGYFLMKPGETGAVTQAATDRYAATLTPEEIEIHILGTASAGGLVRIYGKQWDDRRHMLPADLVITEHDNIWLGYDPGVDHPVGIVLVVYQKAAPYRMVVVKCWTHKGGTIDDDVRLIAGWLNGRRLAGLVYDTNLKNKDRGGGPSVLAQLREKLAIAGVAPLGGWWQSKKNHAPGIALVRDIMTRDLIAVNPSPASGGQIFRQQVKKYRGKESTKFTGEGGIVKKEDETLDCVRYIAMQRPTWRAAYACGRGLGVAPGVGADVEGEPLVVLTPEQTHWNRLLELSKVAGARRARGRHRAF